MPLIIIITALSIPLKDCRNWTDITLHKMSPVSNCINKLYHSLNNPIDRLPIFIIYKPAYFHRFPYAVAPQAAYHAADMALASKSHWLSAVVRRCSTAVEARGSSCPAVYSIEHSGRHGKSRREATVACEHLDRKAQATM